jgi:hypothetical protein
MNDDVTKASPSTDEHSAGILPGTPQAASKQQPAGSTKTDEKLKKHYATRGVQDMLLLRAWMEEEVSAQPSPHSTAATTPPAQ